MNAQPEFKKEHIRKPAMPSDCEYKEKTCRRRCKKNYLSSKIGLSIDCNFLIKIVYCIKQYYT